MGRRVGRPKAGQEPLSRERILAAALRLVDERGVDALSMRRLAAELNVDPMALYHHLPGKRAVLAGVIEAVFAELRVPWSQDMVWQDGVRAFAQAYRALARAHPHLVLHLIADMESGGEVVLAATERLYAALAAANLSPALIVHAANVIVDYVHGFALAESRARLGQFDSNEQRAAWLNHHPPERFPIMRGVVDNLTAGAASDSFEAELDIILAGIAALAPG